MGGQVAAVAPASLEEPEALAGMPGVTGVIITVVLANRMMDPMVAAVVMVEVGAAVAMGAVALVAVQLVYISAQGPPIQILVSPILWALQDLVEHQPEAAVRLVSGKIRISSPANNEARASRASFHDNGHNR